MKMDWWLSGFCFSRALTQMVSMTYAAALPLLQQEWGMSASKAGTISSGFQIGYTISLLVISTLADKLGARILYLGSMVAGGICTLAYALLARGYVSTLILFILVGLSTGGSYTTGLMILADRYVPERRGRATGFYIASTSMGYVVSLSLSGVLLPLGGYQLSFLLISLLSVVGSLASVAMAFKTRVSALVSREKQSFTREVLANRPARLLIIAYTFHCWELFGMWAWMPAFLAACFSMMHFQGLEATGWGSYLSAAFHVAGIVSSYSMGALSDRLGRAKLIFVLSIISVLCSFTFGWSVSWPLPVTLAIGVAYAFSALGDSPVLSAALTEVVHPSHLGAAFGLRSLLGFGASTISPIVFGAILDWTNPSTALQGSYVMWGWAFISLGFPALGAVWAAYLLGRRPL